MPARIAIDERDVLLVIDMQVDFMPGGALAVDGGDAIVPLINRLAQNFTNVVLNQAFAPDLFEAKLPADYTVSEPMKQ